MNNSYYVCSRGILNSCDFHSKVPISSIKYMIEYNLTGFTNGSTLYICSNAFPYFIQNILPYFSYSFILVSGDCDETMPNDIFDNVHTFIENPKIIHWFCQNWVGNHPKVSIIPIGLDYHTMETRNTDWGSQMNHGDQEKQLVELPKIPFYERKLKCYSNFHFFTTTRYGYDRLDAIKKIPNELVFYEPIKIERIQSWKNQLHYAFVISPHGNGLDCHRTWEALCLGCIPIVKTSKIDPLYNDLPVLIVQDWSDINLKLLETTIDEFKLKTFNYNKLTLKYWMDKINSHKYI